MHLILRLKGIVTFVVVLIAPFFCEAQIDLERAALSRMQKGKWLAALQAIQKSLAKDSLNPEAKYLYATYFMATDNPGYNVDSAHHWIRRAEDVIKSGPGRQRTRVDSAMVSYLHDHIDSTGFYIAKVVNSQTSYEHFIDQFSDASQRAKAIELRDELAYVEALKQNNADGFRRYIESFPNSLRYQDASARYEKLIFDEHTAQKKIVEWKKFQRQFPESVYNEEVVQRIFEVTTAAGKTEDYTQYLSEYPTGSMTAKATNILYYLAMEAGDKLPAVLVSDSLLRLIQLNKSYWVPYYHNGLYGFLDEEGNEVMEAKFTTIDSTYRCGNIVSDFVVTSSGLLSRSGVNLLRETPDRAIDLDLGFLKVTSGSCMRVVHKSGFRVGDDCINDAKIVAGRFLALKQGDAWGLFALNGLRLLDTVFEDITSVDHVLLFKRSGKFILVKDSHLKDVADLEPFNDSKVYDDVRAWGDGNLLVRNGVLEGVLDQQLDFTIPLDRHALTKTSFGFIQNNAGRMKLHGVAQGLEQQTFDGVKDYGQWLELIRGRQRSLYKVSSSRIVATDLDSVWIRSGLIFAEKKDSVFVYVRHGDPVAVHKSLPLTFITGKDTLVYFWVPEKKTRAVYDAATGVKLFAADFEDIQSLGRSMFLFSRKDRKGAVKKGILQSDGKVIQPPEYDAIIPTSEGYLSLLKAGKFGLYDLSQKRLIRAEYDRNVMPYSKQYFVAYQGGYGIIGQDEKPVTNFEFDEILYWNDSTAWVKKNFLWSLYNITSKTSKLGKIRSFQVISQNGKEQVVRVQQDNHFGVLSNAGGVIIPVTFNDVINIGSDEKPLYFTEKRVEEAGIYVVIYYNDKGKFIRKEVYEDADYAKIYCDN
jgi:hypothetical protein